MWSSNAIGHRTTHKQRDDNWWIQREKSVHSSFLSTLEESSTYTHTSTLHYGIYNQWDHSFFSQSEFISFCSFIRSLVRSLILIHIESLSRVLSRFVRVCVCVCTCRFDDILDSVVDVVAVFLFSLTQYWRTKYNGEKMKSLTINFVSTFIYGVVVCVFDRSARPPTLPPSSLHSHLAHVYTAFILARFQIHLDASFQSRSHFVFAHANHFQFLLC